LFEVVAQPICKSIQQSGECIAVSLRPIGNDLSKDDSPGLGDAPIRLDASVRQLYLDTTLIATLPLALDEALALQLAQQPAHRRNIDTYTLREL